MYKSYKRKGTNQGYKMINDKGKIKITSEKRIAYIIGTIVYSLSN